MHERLVGEEVTLELPCDDEASTLLLAFIAELLEVDGSDPDDIEATRLELGEAVATLCGRAAGDGTGSAAAGRLQARLLIRADAVEVRLARSESGTEERRLTVRAT